ncbi:hypothetical protein HDV04_003830 [Boothiomyces sp. JEL0838]|nr:hypothetical protein HDV04_003830 [Boothiomyces sp. JEL0838]
MPPPPPAPPPAPMVSSAPPAAQPSALLKSIQKGTKLKKVETNDRSTPVVDAGKGNSVRPTPSPMSLPGRTSQSSRNDAPAAPQLGGLFAGGMPKLKSTGNSISHDNSHKDAPPPVARNRAPSFNQPANPVPSFNARPNVPVPASRPNPTPHTPAFKPTPSPPQPRVPPAVAPRDPPPVAARDPPIVASRNFHPVQSRDPPPVAARDPPPVAARDPPPVGTRSTLQPPAKPSLPSSPNHSPRSSIQDISKPNFSVTSNSSKTITEGRWTFQTDIPLPRQFPSGDPPVTSGIQGKARPPPPPPSRNSVRKAPPVPAPR